MGNMFVCPECAHEWSKVAVAETGEEGLVVKDAHGNVLQDGDTVTVIKDLKVKGSSSVVKVGTKVKISGWSRATTILTARSTASGR